MWIRENRKYREGYNIVRKEQSEKKYKGIGYRGNLEVIVERNNTNTTKMRTRRQGLNI